MLVVSGCAHYVPLECDSHISGGVEACGGNKCEHSKS